MKRSIRKKNFILREDHTFPKEVPTRRICVTINSFFFFFFFQLVIISFTLMTLMCDSRVIL